MAYKNNIPQATDAISQSQSDLLNNFAAIQTLIDIDHVDFANANQGQHNKVTFPVQGGAPVFAAGSLGLYNLAYSGTNQLFFNNAAGTNYPITASGTTGSPVATSGWTYLPSGMLLVWGQATIVAGGTITVNYSSVTGFAGFTTAAMVPQLTRMSTSATTTNFVSVAPALVSNLTQFRAFSSNNGNSVQFAWMTLGL